MSHMSSKYNTISYNICKTIVNSFYILNGGHQNVQTCMNSTRYMWCKSMDLEPEFSITNEISLHFNSMKKITIWYDIYSENVTYYNFSSFYASVFIYNYPPIQHVGNLIKSCTNIFVQSTSATAIKNWTL